MTRERTALARLYEQAVYMVELPTGQVEFRVGAAPDGPLPEGPLAIVTAWNPGLERPSEADNRKANERLRKVLNQNGWIFYPACGRSEDGRHGEPSFAVMDIEPEQALALARQFEQAAVLYWDGVRARLLWSEPVSAAASADDGPSRPC